MDNRLASLRNPDGHQRFYPPGAHPATYRLRMHIAQLESLGDHPELPHLAQALNYARDQLALFEECESEAKAEIWRLLARG